MSGRRVKEQRRQERQRKADVVYIARAERAGGADLAARIGPLTPLKDKTAAVVGLGTLGAPTVLELARSLVGRLHLLDGDIVEAGTTVRWPLGIIAAGQAKTIALDQFISVAYPHTEVQRWERQLGMVDLDANATSPAPSEQSVLEDFFDGADVVIDATAELGVNYLVSELALDAGIPYISISATQGAWGGMVFRQIPGSNGGCWFCLQEALDSKAITPPLADPDGETQPMGCASPTFTGPSFDMMPIVAEGVRTAVAALMAATPAYPQPSWDVNVLALRDPAGGYIPPTWTPGAVRRSPRCPRCSRC